MKDFKVSVTGFGRKQGFNRIEFEEVSSLIAKYPKIIQGKNFIEFAAQVGLKGHAFCTATFKDGVKSKETFEQSQLLALNFDIINNGELTYERIKKRAELYNLPILLSYDAFSIRTHKRFGFVFLNDTPFSDLKEAEVAQKALMTIFPEANESCGDVFSLHSGGNKILYFDKTMPEINVDSLFMNMCLYLKIQYGDTNYKRKIIEFSKATGVALNAKKLPDISIVEDSAENYIENIDDKNSPITTIDILRSGEKLSTLKYKINFINGSEVSSDQKNTIIHRTYRSYDLDTIRYNCRLYQEFDSGKRMLSQHELLGVVSNITQVEAGAVKFKSTLRSKGYFNGREELYANWNYYIHYIKDKEPRPCSSFCPYHNTCPHGGNILSTSKPQYHQIERIANCDDNLVGLDEAWEDFEENFQKAIISDERIWHVILCQTALGKTQAILELLKDTQLRVLVAVPTNKLKREVCERAKKMGIDVIVSPSLHELQDELPEDVWDDIESLYNRGKSPMSRLYKAIRENDVRCVKLIKKYIKELNEFGKSDGHAITTHRRLASLDVSKYDLVIIDEDIIYSTIIPNRVTVSISQLKKLKKKLPVKDPLVTKIKEIVKESRRSDFFTLDDIEYDKETYGDIKKEINIPALCSAHYFCNRKESDWEDDLDENCVSFIEPVKFHKDVKYIMLSATVNQDVCKYCFGENNVIFYACKEAKITGTLNQFYDKPMSRSYMSENPNIIAQIKEWSGVENTISFKKFENKYGGDLHFGNCAGCDTLKNEDIDVIGTPHQPEWIYKLFAYSLDFDVDEKLKPQTTVVNNGYRFRFTSYNDKVLRTIQFYMIESELEQAVGRARLLRCDCTVNLFSNFPLKQAVMKESKYGKDD